MVDDPTQVVGLRVKALRAERGLTVRELAEAGDLAANTISLIERGKTSPTIATLHKLATALGVPLASLVEDRVEREVIFLRRHQRPRARSVRVVLEHLGAGLPDQTMEPLLLTLEPGANSGPDPIVHTGHEFVFCLEGSIDYRVDRKLYRLEPEDSLLFEAHLQHSWHNSGAVASRMILILQAEEGREAARRQHL